MNRPFNLFTLVLLVPFVLAGCATPGGRSNTTSSLSSAAMASSASLGLLSAKPIPVAGFYHVVETKETLYRISQNYDVPIGKIMKANLIKDPSKIRRGQALFIPDLKAAKKVKGYQPVPLYRNNGKWKYIVIHHTATLSGDKESISLLHRKRGFGELGYHFLIDNGTRGRSIGQIEIGSRWLEQKDGAHAKDDNMNTKGIGVSLVGNFSEQTLAEEQLQSLAYLVNTLRFHYKIPKWRVIGHRDVRGAATECPGSRFPWKRFKQMLDS